MQRLQFRFLGLSVLPALLWTAAAASATFVQAQAASPTPSPENSSSGIYITVLYDEPFVNVRKGPSSTAYLEPVGRLLPGETAAALGRSPGGDWILIAYSGGPNNEGWVYSALVQISPPGSTLRIIEPPPTPVPPATATIDPTLAAQFTIFPTNTRLPTFTPAPSLSAPEYTIPPPSNDSDSVPMALVLASLGGAGLAGLIGSLIFRRR